MTQAQGGSEPPSAGGESQGTQAAAPLSEGEAVSVEQVLAEKDAQIDALRSEILYQRAEVENFKKRTEKRYREALEYATEPLLRDLLPVLDNLERAAAHAGADRAPSPEALAEGLAQVIRQFHEAIGRHGVEFVEAHGVRFDPKCHEAVAQVAGDAPGLVAEVYEKGCTLRGRLLRPAKVSVTGVAPSRADG